MPFSDKEILSCLNKDCVELSCFKYLIRKSGQKTYCILSIETADNMQNHQFDVCKQPINVNFNHRQLFPILLYQADQANRKCIAPSPSCHNFRLINYAIFSLFCFFVVFLLFSFNFKGREMKRFAVGFVIVYICMIVDHVGMTLR